MLDTNLVAQAKRLASLYEEVSRAAFPYKEVRKLLRKAGTKSDRLIPDLDLYFSTLAGYCSWGRRLLIWDDKKVQEAKVYVERGFYDRHPEYRSLRSFINESELNHQLEAYEEMRRDLLSLLISLQHYRRDNGQT